MITTSTSQLIVSSGHYTTIAKALDCEEHLVTNLSKWPWSLPLCQCVLSGKKTVTKSFMTPNCLHAKSLMIVSRSVQGRIQPLRLGGWGFQ